MFNIYSTILYIINQMDHFQLIVVSVGLKTVRIAKLIMMIKNNFGNP